MCGCGWKSRGLGVWGGVGGAGGVTSEDDVEGPVDIPLAGEEATRVQEGKQLFQVQLPRYGVLVKCPLQPCHRATLAVTRAGLRGPGAH